MSDPYKIMQEALAAARDDLVYASGISAWQADFTDTIAKIDAALALPAPSELQNEIRKIEGDQ